MIKTLRPLFLILCLMVCRDGMCGPDTDMPVLHVEGRYLTDADGNTVNLHGFAQTYSPWFNEQGTKWSNYNVAACLRYNQEKIDQMLAAGWRMDFVRLHMDPYWSNKPGVATTGENDISAFDFERFKTYLENVFAPMAEYAVSRGLYVVMRPPGVCPEEIEIGGAYHDYLKRVWGYVSTYRRLTDNPHVMFELANEPVRIKGTDGVYGANNDGCNRNLTAYFQEIVDLMRGNGCNNILWIPGTGYQSHYAGFAKYPVKGDNIGYAVHVYPGWYGSDAIEPSQELGGSYGGGFGSFSAGWEAQIKPVAEMAPVMVTEMDWAPSKYNKSWGKSITGSMLKEGFGANFKLLADNTGNVSWLLFTGCELLAAFKDEPGVEGNYTFLNDPQACPWPVYHWYKEYAGEKLPSPSEVELAFSMSMDLDNCEIMTGGTSGMAVIATYADGYQSTINGNLDVTVSDPGIVSWSDGLFTANKIGVTSAVISCDIDGKHVEKSIRLKSTPFPFVTGFLNPSIWETGTFNQSTHEIRTGQYGFAGWKYPSGIDLSGYRYLIAEMEGANNAAVSFRVFDVNNYWDSPAMKDFGTSGRVVFDLEDLRADNGRKMDASHVYIVGFWSLGNAPFKISKVYLSDRPDGESGIESVTAGHTGGKVDVYNMQGVRVRTGVSREAATEGLNRGLYVVGGEKVFVR